MPIKPIVYRDGAVELIDQRCLPEEQVSLRITNVDEVADTIRTMAIRGAPAIGIAVAYGETFGDTIPIPKGTRTVGHRQAD